MQITINPVHGVLPVTKIAKTAAAVNLGISAGLLIAGTTLPVVGIALAAGHVVSTTGGNCISDEKVAAVKANMEARIQEAKERRMQRKAAKTLAAQAKLA